MASRRTRAWNSPGRGSQRFLHTALTALAPSSSDSDSDSSSSDIDHASILGAEEDDSEEEAEQWKQFRDVGDGSDDDDADHVDAKIPQDRFVLPEDVRRKSAASLNAEGDPVDSTGGAAVNDAPPLIVEGPLQDKCVASSQLCLSFVPPCQWLCCLVCR